MGGFVSWAALVLALASLAAVVLAGPGYRMGLWGVKGGVQAMGVGAIAAAVAGLLGLIGLLVLIGTAASQARWMSVAALVVGLVIAVPLLVQGAKARQLPRIHDISTTPDEALPFVAILPLRQGAPNSLAHDPKVAAAQKKGYPDLAPLTLKLPPAQAYERAERVARAMGWEVVAADAKDMRIEATATSLLFGFKDDVVIRISAAPEGSRVDMRSSSRVGISDLGVNAGRIRAYFAKLSAA
jgi:uncharacterized protein (DUF1499 family)